MSDRCAFSAKHEQYAATKLEIQRQREENKIMLMSLDSISDPKDREYFEMRKNEITQRRARESQQQQSTMTFGYNNFANMNMFQGDTQALVMHFKFQVNMDQAVNTEQRQIMEELVTMEEWVFMKVLLDMEKVKTMEEAEVLEQAMDMEEPRNESGVVLNWWLL